MPVYNSTGTVENAINSLIKQSFTDFELIISDNCSYDGTYEQLQEIALTDKRIKLIRQPTNIGATKNFEYVLFKSTGKYFMWAAADDFWLPEFVQENVAFLESHSDYVSSISKVRYMGDKIYPDRQMGTFPLVGTYQNNLIAYMMKPAANSRFYSIHRSNSIRKSWVNDDFWAMDWTVICNLLKLGKFNETCNVQMLRGAGGASKNPFRTISRSNTLSRLDKAFPLAKFSFLLLKDPVARGSLKILIVLLIYNAVYTLKMFSGWLRSLISR
jgi:glycosyltransferase involved in cell wall biosynthesis